VANNKEKKGKFGITFQTSYRFNNGKVTKLRDLPPVKRKERKLITGYITR